MIVKVADALEKLGLPKASGELARHTKFYKPYLSTLDELYDAGLEAK